MPNRIIKESLLTSDKIASLSDFEFRLWVGLILSVDDAGRGDARPAIIKGRVFPLRERVSLKDIEVAIHGLAAKGCISLYKVGGKSYFWFPTWDNHQRIRDSKPKYPSPENADADSLPQSAATCGDPPPESNPNPIQSESESKGGARAGRPHHAPENWGFGAALTDALKDWLCYKREKRQEYKPIGQKSLITQVKNNAEKYGETAVADLIRQCMAANWQGIVWGKLDKPAQNKGKVKDFQPSPDRIQKNNDWLDEFLAEQKGGGKL